MVDISEKIIQRKIIGIIHNYFDRVIRIHLDDNTTIIFNECALVFDLGIIGQTISFISYSGTLGMALELKKTGADPADYNYILLSKDIHDLTNKNELLIAYKTVEFNAQR